MKRYLFLLLLLSAISSAAQTFLTRNGQIQFFSKTPLEDIRAEHKQVYAVVDTEKKKMAFTLLMKGFVFPKQLMQDHFNENYVESDKYPKASFSGTYTSDADISKEGIYSVTVSGQLTLHGVTRTIQVPATLQRLNNKLIGKAYFKIKPADYQITIPALVRDKIAKEIEVQVLIECTPSK